MILLFIPQNLALGKTLRGHCLLLLGPLSTLSPRSKLIPGGQDPSTGSDKQSRCTVCSSNVPEHYMSGGRAHSLLGTTKAEREERRGPRAHWYSSSWAPANVQAIAINTQKLRSAVWSLSSHCRTRSPDPSLLRIHLTISLYPYRVPVRNPKSR